MWLFEMCKECKGSTHLDCEDNDEVEGIRENETKETYIIMAIAYRGMPDLGHLRHELVEDSVLDIELVH